LHSNYSQGQLKDFVNREQIGVRPFAKDCEVVLHIGKKMALSSKNVHAKYEVLGVPGFVMPKNEIISVWSRRSKEYVDRIELIKLIFS
jgi:hypothetical protein